MDSSSRISSGVTSDIYLSLFPDTPNRHTNSFFWLKKTIRVARKVRRQLGLGEGRHGVGVVGNALRSTLP